MSRQKELDIDPKTIQQIEFVGQLKNSDNEIVLINTFLTYKFKKKIKEIRLKFFQGSVTVIIKDGKLMKKRWIHN